MKLESVRTWLFLPIVVALGGCAQELSPSDRMASTDLSFATGPDSTHVEFPKLVRAIDVDERDDVVEVILVAERVKKQYLEAGEADVLAYRDGARRGAVATVPGPLIEAKRGDRVVVRLRNELAEPTTIHWHGVRVPNFSDGTPMSQLEVPPGGEFRYDFVVRDAATFWYHPHIHGDRQIERGLQGMLVVHDDVDIHDVDIERNLVLDDVKLDAVGNLSQETTHDDVMMGRIGNLLLVNGAKLGRARAVSDSRERWRIVNTANGRYFNLKLPGHVFRVIGWDGGLLERPYETETLLVTPGERFDVLVDLKGKVGANVPLQTIYYDRGHGTQDTAPQDLLTLELATKARTPPEPLHDELGSPIERTPSASAPERLFVLNEEMLTAGDVRFTINGASAPSVPPLRVREGDAEIWSFKNDSEMDHPMHVHGLFFRVLDVNGAAPAHVGWKDTVNVPAKSKVRLALQYDAPGRWLYHCHVLEHAELGMTGEFQVVRRGDPLLEPSKPTGAIPQSPPVGTSPPSSGAHAGHGTTTTPSVPPTSPTQPSGGEHAGHDPAMTPPTPRSGGDHAGHTSTTTPPTPTVPENNPPPPVGTAGSHAGHPAPTDPSGETPMEPAATKPTADPHAGH